MKRTAGRSGPSVGKRKGSRRQAKWGDWRPVNVAGSLLWNTPVNLASAAVINVEIAGVSASLLATQSVPFDPGQQLAGGTVTLAEEMTFDVQLGGWIYVDHTNAVANPVDFIFFLGVYRSDWNGGAGAFVLPPRLDYPNGYYDKNWSFKKVISSSFPVFNTQMARVDAFKVPVSTTMRIGRGKAMLLNMTSNATGVPSTNISINSFLTYRIRKNVD